MIIAYAMFQDRASSFANRLGGREVEIGVSGAGWILASVSLLGGEVYSGGWAMTDISSEVGVFASFKL